MLRSTWRGLETESRLGLHGHERGNPGYGQDPNLADHRASPRPYRETEPYTLRARILSSTLPPTMIARPSRTSDPGERAGVVFWVISALVHNSEKGPSSPWPRLASSDHLAVGHPERCHGVQNLAPNPRLDSL